MRRVTWSTWYQRSIRLLVSWSCLRETLLGSRGVFRQLAVLHPRFVWCGISLVHHLCPGLQLGGTSKVLRHGVPQGLSLKGPPMSLAVWFPKVLGCWTECVPMWWVKYGVNEGSGHQLLNSHCWFVDNVLLKTPCWGPHWTLSPTQRRVGIRLAPKHPVSCSPFPPCPHPPETPAYLDFCHFSPPPLPFLFSPTWK